MSNTIWLFTDGSSLIEGKKYESSSGCVIYINDELVDKFGVYHNNGTNSLGELYAIMIGLDRIDEIIASNKELKDSTVIVVADSEYAVKSLNSYIYSWIKQGFNGKWKTSKGTIVAYQDIMLYIWENFISSYKYPLRIWHVCSHIGKKITKEKALKKFNIFNKTNFTSDEFENIIKRNDEVDKLSDMIRRDKKYFYEEVYDTKWVKNRRENLTRNGRIVIRKKNLRS